MVYILSSTLSGYLASSWILTSCQSHGITLGQCLRQEWFLRLLQKEKNCALEHCKKSKTVHLSIARRAKLCSWSLQEEQNCALEHCKKSKSVHLGIARRTKLCTWALQEEQNCALEHCKRSKSVHLSIAKRAKLYTILTPTSTVPIQQRETVIRFSVVAYLRPNTEVYYGWESTGMFFAFLKTALIWSLAVAWAQNTNQLTNRSFPEEGFRW